MAGIPEESWNRFSLNFAADKTNLLALNTCVKYGPDEILHSRKQRELTSHLFNHKVSDYVIFMLTRTQETRKAYF